MTDEKVEIEETVGVEPSRDPLDAGLAAAFAAKDAAVIGKSGHSLLAASASYPERIGRYCIEKVLGQGGFGLVFLAHDEQLQRRVAVKVPHARLISQPEDVQAYLAEARTVANLDHPHIVPVHDVGSTDQCPCFVVSKYVEGTDLATKIKEQRPSARESAELVATMAEALHYAHQQGFVHRDVKPDNILLGHDGKPYIVDFGLALKEENVGKGPRFAGTPAYMSPEQARGEGHRVDGRSDIFSLCVVLYELLVGRRPFHGDTQTELLERVATWEPKPPRQHESDLAHELERICLKGLSKRSTERYTTAQDLADDLRHFLNASPETVSHTAPAVEAASEDTQRPADTGLAASGFRSQTIRMVPKGLRAFDEHDADFFLELLPGARDRYGLPESIRFWKTRVEEPDPDKTFPVGLIYGPSGCGKSSLVKAGLLPRLAEDVVPVYIEATAEDTENRLQRGLRKCCPTLADNLSLKDALTSVRQGAGIPVGKKLVIVIDQFEQWLHARREQENSDLVQALRQCDGGRVQCLLMVRDDFWMAVTRFLNELETELVQGHNFAPVDLFPVPHAEKVLAAFGRAFGALPEDPRQTSTHHEHFLTQAVAGLAQEGQVICVRLALFAEMVKAKPWTPATLQAVGGTEGVGVTFLEETFSTPSNPKHRFHQKAARAVLKTLLPESGTNIKGHMRSYEQLLDASGYARRPQDFAELMRILNSEIRLITPTDPEGLDADDESAQQLEVGKSYYQLTHDYLVPALRDWLTRKQRETRRGRAQMRLEELAAAWKAKPEKRHLPNVFEWLDICCLRPPRTWSVSQRQMMRAAARQHLVKVGLLALLLALAGFVAREWRASLQAASLVSRLKSTEVMQVSDVISEISPYRRWADPLLRRMSDGLPMGDPIRLKQSLALLPVDPGQVERLYDKIFDANPGELYAISAAMSEHSKELAARLWDRLETEADPRRRFRAACALARWDSLNANWEGLIGEVAAHLVMQDPLHVDDWFNNLFLVRDRLGQSLTAICHDPTKSESERLRAIMFAVGTSANDECTPEEIELFLDLDGWQYDLLLPQVKGDKSLAVSLDKLLARRPAPAASDADRDRLARRQANAAVLLLQLDQDNDYISPSDLTCADHLWPLFRTGSDARLRTYLVHRLGSVAVEPETLIQQFDVEKDIVARRTLLLSIGGITSPMLAAVRRPELAQKLLPIYRDDPDPGIHSAVEWLLRKWDFGEEIDKINREQLGQPAVNRSWYLSPDSNTLAVISTGPVEFQMGTSVEELDRQAEKASHRQRIAHSFALATKEITVKQFREFLQACPGIVHDGALTDKFSRDPEGPVLGVTWFEAAQYCRWLSEREEIPEEQMCYPPIPDIKPGMQMPSDYLTRTGYRLPTEAEWEYACRAGTNRSRHYGAGDDMLDYYGWHLGNSHNRTWTVGSKLPNEYGLFDMYGNAWEWCQDAALETVGAKNTNEFAIGAAQKRVLRGGSFRSPASNVHSAYRSEFRSNHASGPESARVAVGLRVARTLPARRP